MSVFSRTEQAGFRRAWTLQNLLSSIQAYSIVNKKALFSPGFVWIFAILLSALMLYMYAMSGSFVRFGKEVVSESSAWSGVRRAEQGFLIGPQSAGPSIAEVGIDLKRKRRYAVEINATCKAGMQYRIDFFGPGYDSPAQEAALACADKISRFIVKSQIPPESTSLRQPFTSPTIFASHCYQTLNRLIYLLL
jgi:hypothetical protein